MDPMFDADKWQPKQRITNMDQLIAEAWDCWARSLEYRQLAPRAKMLARICLDQLYKSRNGGEKHHRLLIFELQGRIHADNELEALDWTSEAVECALALEAHRAIRRLYYRRALVHRDLLQMGAGCRDLEGALDAYHHEDVAPTPEGAEFLVRATVQLANACIFRGEWTRAKTLLSRVFVLLDQTKPNLPEEANARALWAHIHRCEERPWLALRPAIDAAQIFDLHGRHDSAGRIHISAAEIALDLATWHSTGTLRDDYLDCALEHTEEARENARIHRDTGLRDLAILAQARREALIGHPEGYSKRIYRIIHQTSSPLMLAQAWTTMGKVVGAQGNADGALYAFNQVKTVLKDSDVSAYGIWAHRALFRQDQKVNNWWQ